MNKDLYMIFLKKIYIFFIEAELHNKIQFNRFALIFIG